MDIFKFDRYTLLQITCNKNNDKFFQIASSESYK